MKDSNINYATVTSVTDMFLESKKNDVEELLVRREEYKTNFKPIDGETKDEEDARFWDGWYNLET